MGFSFKITYTVIFKESPLFRRLPVVLRQTLRVRNYENQIVNIQVHMLLLEKLWKLWRWRCGESLVLSDCLRQWSVAAPVRAVRHQQKQSMPLAAPLHYIQHQRVPPVIVLPNVTTTTVVSHRLPQYSWYSINNS